MTMDVSSFLELVVELQSLDDLPRTGYVQKGVSNPESVSEHSYQTALLALLLAPEFPGLDALKVIQLALLHDVAEVRIGDLPHTVAYYLGQQKKRAVEMAAAKDLFRGADGRASQLVSEFLRQESTEARFVSACDKIQLLVKVLSYESRGHRGLDEFWESLSSFSVPEFPYLHNLLDRIRLRRRELRAMETTSRGSTAPDGE